MSSDALLSDTQQRTFNFFWQTTDLARGLAPDLTPDAAPASIAAMGFALTAVPIGVEHGWVARGEAARRVRGWLEFLRDAPQGPDASGMSGYKGFFYHFLDMTTGTRYRDSELSTVDTALLFMGVRFCGQYFNGAGDDEAAIRTIADFLCERADWNWMQANSAGICMGWRPETGFLAADWVGYNEAMFVYLLALGSASHAVGTDAWAVWTSGYANSWGTIEGVEHLTFGALFAHQFTQVWVNLQGINDAYMGAKGFDYFENSRRAVLSQRAYAIANPMAWAGYGADIWGLSACDGPFDGSLYYRGVLTRFHTYAARGVYLHPADQIDDGTLSVSATLGCLPFAPDLVIPAVAAMYQRYGAVIYGTYGFLDSYNPSFNYDVPLVSGRRVGNLGWVDSRYYGLTQGPIVAMIENYRSGLIWRVMQNDPVIRRGLQRAGFTGGWLG
ncbi:MAG TPA: glucoamylase family protein [Steroidobacteraceae bacterium]|nr:glucoamylase family protein [Steroidobacteraceae bacterium]